MATTGIRKRHSRRCRSRDGGPCDCSPSFESWVWSRRYGSKISRTFSGPGAFAAAKQWRAEATTATNRGRLRRPTRTIVRQAAEQLIGGMEDGSTLSARRRRYRPSTIRGYRRALGLDPEMRQRAPERVLERLGEVRLSELDREQLQEYANRLAAAGWDASTIQGQFDPLRVLLRLARRRREIGVDPFEDLHLEKPQGRRDRIAQPGEAAS